jgi:hypothetical protein
MSFYEGCNVSCSDFFSPLARFAIDFGSHGGVCCVSGCVFDRFVGGQSSVPDVSFDGPFQWDAVRESVPGPV